MKSQQKSEGKQRLRRHFLHSAVVFLGYSLLYTLFFSSVLFSDRLLAPGDGISFFLPAFYGAKTLWSTFIFSGYPIAADPQNMTWYPPGLLLSFIPDSWNAFTILAYVLASSFGYCYTYLLTGSKLAAIATGLIYSLSGFMISHLGHTAMIHAAAWIPLIVCALEKLRYQFERGWFAVGMLAVACCFLGGHPQISVYGIGIGVSYALLLGWNAPVGRWRYYRWAVGCIGLGLGLCGIQLLPTVELSQLSVRADMPFEQFVTYSLPVWQAPQMLFPYFFSGRTPPFDSPNWGEWDLTEITGYVGFLPVLLAITGAISYSKRSISIYWFCVGLVTLLLAFGDGTFLAHLLYQVPVYNKFRAQGRHFVELALAVSVLAGLGISAIQQRRVSKRLIHNTLIASGTTVFACLLGMGLFYGRFESKASKAGIARLSLSPWDNPAIGIPLLVFGLGAIALVLLARCRKSRWSHLLLLSVLLIDMSSFGLWFSNWDVSAPPKQRIELNPTIRAYRDALLESDQRFVNSEVATQLANPDGIFPNLTRLWQLPSASGYSPLLLSRVSEMMKMSQDGSIAEVPVHAYEHQLDLMAVRYLLAPFPGMTEQKGLVWSPTNFNLSLGAGVCSTSSSGSTVVLDLPERLYPTTTIGLVTTLGCSVGIRDGVEVVQVQITDAQGNVEVHSLQAGRDTAEQAYDCLDVKPDMQHQRAEVFDSVPVPRPNGTNCQSHKYVSTIQLAKTQQVKSLRFTWAALPAVMDVSKISLFNNQQEKSMPVNAIGLSKKWKPVEQLSSGTLYENQQVLPRAWLVPETIPLQPEDILKAIHTSQLPNGQVYEPRAMALVEDNSAVFTSTGLQPADGAKVLKIEGTQAEIQTNASASAFLVLSDVFYPGWKASIDGKPTRIFQTNYIQRGVKVPAGEHIVRFEFQPMSFKLGAGITAASFFGGGYWLLRYKKHVPE